MSAEPVKFLLVDDTEENLVALEALLRRENLVLLRARSGSEALELLLVHDVALAILDVQMPDMNGFELAELMRGAERTKHVPIIFVTAGARDPQRVFKGYESGAVDFLHKPIDPQALRGKADVFYQLYRQKQELASSLRLNELFVGIIGHDLRNPLSAIVNGARVLEPQLTDEKQLRTLRRMTAAGQRMTDMIEQLLDLTRARLAGGVGFVRVRNALDVAALVRRTVDELAGAHPQREVAVSVRGDCASTGDAQRLLQLFSNLVANALIHGAPGTPVAVSVDGLGEEIVVRVANAGAIPDDVVPRLFDPFGGRASGDAGVSGGLGLGLYISQQIAAAHGGSIEVASNESDGTAFTVRLPRRAAAMAAASSASGKAAGLAKRVLIVDDDEHIRESLREAFEDEGYQAATASNGGEALDLLRRRDEPRYDVAILDLVLPVLDGGGVYQAMQADAALASIPVIVSTSNPARAPAGVIVVPKPLILERLLDTVAGLWREEERR